MSPAELRLQDVATRFGCWPDDVTSTMRGTLLDATIGTRKGRPHRVVIKPDGRVLSRREVAALEAA